MALFRTKRRWKGVTALFAAVVLLGAAVRRVKKPPSENVLRRRRLETVEESFDVTLFVQLLYVNHTVASMLEDPRPPNEVDSHFCWAVNQQASGNQVTLATQHIPAVFETRKPGTLTGATAVDYECTILETNRRYDNDGEGTFLQGYFILELAVQQIVHVTTDSNDNISFTLEEVTAIVVSGFNRGFGGRVRFRSLLQQHPDFATVINVEVLEGSLSPPQAAPSATPSAAPSAEPSAFPSTQPSAGPSVAPSQSPTSAPSVDPTVSLATDDPTQNPTTTPTVAPIDSPSPMPVSVNDDFIPGQLTDNDEEEKARPGLILTAIAGGVATIVASCFLIYCVWKPFCGRKNEEDRGDASGDSSASPPAAETMIPGVLTLDDENQSLANTTLGESDFRGSVPRPKSATKMDVSMLDSFDESSIYTSTFSTSTEVHRYTGTPIVTTDNLPSVTVTDSPVNMEEVNEESSEYESPSSSESSSEPGSPFAPPHAVEGREEERKEASHRATKGYDPFADDQSSRASSSFATESMALSDPSFPVNSVDGQFSSSTKTKRIKNSFRDVAASPVQYIAGIQEEKVAPDENGSKVVENEVSADDDSQENKQQNYHDRANNSLLRTVLEDARLLSENSSVSSRSRASRKSAPTLLAGRPARMQRTSHRQRDLLADNQDLEEALSFSSARSVGATPRLMRKEVRRVGVSPETKKSSVSVTKTNAFYRTQYRETSSLDAVSSKSEVGSDGQNDPLTYELSQGVVGDFNVLVSPASSDFSTAVGTGTLGAVPRDEANCGSFLDEQVDTPVSSPGVLGIASKRDTVASVESLDEDSGSTSSEGPSNPWLFDNVEQVLGPRSPAADMESISGRSVRSGRSHKSRLSAKSAGSRSRSNKSTLTTGSARSRSPHKSPLSRQSVRTSPRTPPGSRPSRSSTADPLINGSKNNEGKTTIPITPRTLEHDLNRLEMHVGYTRKSGEDQKETPSIAASSAGRSTASAKRSKKKRVIVSVPPGKLGVVLADRHDGKGTFVSEVRPSSSMKGVLSPGDKLVAVDGDDVTLLGVPQITKMMASRSERERRLTVITSSVPPAFEQEEKHYESP